MLGGEEVLPMALKEERRITLAMKALQIGEEEEVVVMEVNFLVVVSINR